MTTLLKFKVMLQSFWIKKTNKMNNKSKMKFKDNKIIKNFYLKTIFAFWMLFQFYLSNKEKTYSQIKKKLHNFGMNLLINLQKIA